MNKRKTTFVIGLYSVMNLLVIHYLGVADGSDKGAKERVIVDLTQPRNGCADCHQGTIKTPDGKEKDITLAGEVKIISKHPALDVKATIKDCIKCHGAGERKIQLINTLHDIHLNSPIYVGEFKQTCSGCHDMRHIKGL